MTVVAPKLGCLIADGINNLGDDPLPNLLSITEKQLLHLTGVYLLRDLHFCGLPSKAIYVPPTPLHNLIDKSQNLHFCVSTSPRHSMPRLTGTSFGGCARTWS